MNKAQALKKLDQLLATDTFSSVVINDLSSVKTYISEIPACPKCDSTYVKKTARYTISYGSGPYMFFTCKDCSNEWDIDLIEH